MGTATFIENDYNTETAKAIIYNAKWFEILLLLLVINFIGNIVKYNLFSIKKAPILLFHVAFIITILGAGITRYRGYEALITINEGESNDKMISIDNYLQVITSNGSINKNHISEPILMSELGFNDINESFNFEEKNIQIRLKKYVPRAKYELKDTISGNTYLHMVIAENENRKDFYIQEGTREIIYGIPIAFNTQNKLKTDIFITKQNQTWQASFPEVTDYFSMLLNKAGSYPKDSIVPLKFKALSQINDIPIVFNEIVQNKVRKLVSVEKNPEIKNPEAAVTLFIQSGAENKEITLFGGPGYMNPFNTLFINDLHVKLRYGAKPIQLPFSIFLKDFILERYPGSDSPSAFYSDLEIQEKNRVFNYTIFMNNVLNHQGYRFFQSAYLPDESGTILSVNRDYWGTLITYIGYGLLFLGMLLSLFWKNSHFGLILKLLR
ncbi:cytochrome c biogenesis protein ResB [Aquimarina sp. MMG016]|uniref:cytochrome c biogenesis protein ResB n=1 Tax=Aquimarina sp. MMG016 TaxID=2822690 RepID=UPI001B3A28AF|nr:cytochrome c biogenesis protein ResB [Aquimarina sp. MMG016]MBQ4821074.1 cytochrome c biogenesis protein ResB [Aquimarina sp. MMG016]